MLFDVLDENRDARIGDFLGCFEQKPFQLLSGRQPILLLRIGALSAACVTSMAQPGTGLGNWRDYEQAGYVAMNALTTPLLHYVHTGQMFDARLLASDAEGLLPPDLRLGLFQLAHAAGRSLPRRIQDKGNHGQARCLLSTEPV